MAKAKAKRSPVIKDISIPKPVYKKKTRKGFERPPGPYCQYCGSTYGIERHHIKPKGMGGTWNPEIHSEENRCDLCPLCHDRAQQYWPGYMPEDLYRKKAEDESRLKEYEALLGC